MSTERRRKDHSGVDPIEGYRKDFDAAERKVAGEIDPGARAMVVAIGVMVLLLSFVLPHAGSANGWDVLSYTDAAVAERIILPSRIFVWLALVFGVLMSMLALVTRRWVLAWIAVAGTAVSMVAGMLAIWSRQTAPDGGAGPGIGLIVAWLTVIVLTFHWLKVVWSRTALHLAAEAERREHAAENEDYSPFRLR